jgi:hypothetical protein
LVGLVLELLLVFLVLALAPVLPHGKPKGRYGNNYWHEKHVKIVPERLLSEARLSSEAKQHQPNRDHADHCPQKGS